MKKIITIMLALVLIVAMTIPASAVTPTLDTPAITIPDISGSVHVELADGYWDSYFEDHPIDIQLTEEPTELPKEAFSYVPEWLSALFRW